MYIHASLFTLFFLSISENGARDCSCIYKHLYMYMYMYVVVCCTGTIIIMAVIFILP